MIAKKGDIGGVRKTIVVQTRQNVAHQLVNKGAQAELRSDGHPPLIIVLKITIKGVTIIERLPPRMIHQFWVCLLDGWNLIEGI